MLEQNKPMTHTVWAQYYQSGKFRRWLDIGEARCEVDGTGKPIAHIFENRTPKGDNGYRLILPIGVQPSPPKAEPQRPASNQDDTEEE